MEESEKLPMVIVVKGRELLLVTYSAYDEDDMKYYWNIEYHNTDGYPEISTHHESIFIAREKMRGKVKEITTL